MQHARALMAGDTGFGRLLAAHRQRRGLQQRVLADRVGLNKTVLGYFETGDRQPASRDIVVRLATALDLSPEDTDQLLDRAGFLPRAYEQTGLLDADLRRLALVLGDATIPAAERAAVRLALRLLLRRWCPGAITDEAIGASVGELGAIAGGEGSRAGSRATAEAGGTPGLVPEGD